MKGETVLGYFHQSIYPHCMLIDIIVAYISVSLGISSIVYDSGCRPL